MAFDGIVTRAIAAELGQLNGARVDKIFQPNPQTIILGIYFDGMNYAINICTNPQNYRIHLTTYSKTNPKVAPNFCMVLRKHLLGLRIKNIITNHLERIITIEFEGFDDVDDLITKKLIVELMGKHCNIILLDEDGLIVDSLRHIANENSPHIVIPHQKYHYPKIEKLDFLACTDFSTFKEEIKTTDPSLIASLVSNTYHGISKKFVQWIIDDLKKTDLEEIYHYLKEIIEKTDSLSLAFQISDNDYFLVPSKTYTPFSLNFSLDDFYQKKEETEELKTSRNSMLKLILTTLKKYQKRLLHINEKLTACDHMETYRLYGELLTSNLYRIPNENLKEITLENYYENNQPITIPLDQKYLPSVNAKRYFKQYHKLKNTLEIVTKQKQETIEEVSYLESIVYELESASCVEEIAEILEEISENVIFKDQLTSYQKKKKAKVKQSSLTKNKTVAFNPIKYQIDGYTFLVGRNNKENDYLSLKYANKSDLWFHTKEIHGSHAVLVLNGKVPGQELLVKCAQIVAYHSKARHSSNVPVDICEVKFVKKPKNAKPGMVIYTNYKTLYVDPKKP